MEEIDIWWEGPFSLNDIIENKIKKEDSDNIQKDVGLYQIYSSHPLYGTDVLVYIGLTTDSFKRRLKNRWVIESGNDSNNVKIYLGCIFSQSKIINIETQIEKIKKAEALLINALKPAFNSSNIQSVHEKYATSNYQINNINNYRNLYPQLSSEYFWKDQFENYEITEKLAKEYETNVRDENEFYGFDLPENNNICLGVDYSYWNKENIPLVIGVCKKCNIKKSKLENIFQHVGVDQKYYFISASDDLTKKDVLKEVKEKLKIVIELCEK